MTMFKSKIVRQGFTFYRVTWIIEPTFCAEARTISIFSPYRAYGVWNFTSEQGRNWLSEYGITDPELENRGG